MDRMRTWACRSKYYGHSDFEYASVKHYMDDMSVRQENAYVPTCFYPYLYCSSFTTTFSKKVDV